MKQRYAVVFEQTPNNYSAYVPDLLGCVSTAGTLEEIQEMIREAITFHIEGMVEDDEPFPEPRMSLKEVESNHNQALSQYVKETLAEFGEEGPELPATFRVIEVEVADELLTQAGRVGWCCRR